MNKNEMPINKKLAIDEAIKKCNKLKINLNDKNYVNNPEFKNFYKEICFSEGHMISYAWWIEKNIIGQERLEKFFSPYSLKISRKLTDEERKPSYFYKYISESSELEYMTDDLVKRYFYRNEPKKFGLIKRLQKIGFNIESLSKNPYNQDGYLRLLYYLYNFEKNNNIELTRLLNTPTLENEDSRFNILNTHNGELIGKIKENISYAIDSDYIKSLNKTYFKIETEFENLMLIFRLRALNLSADKKNSYSSAVKKFIKEIQHDTPKKVEDEPILEYFFFKICQYEHLGIEYDIIDIYNEISSHFHEGDNYEINYSEYTDVYISKDCLNRIVSNDISDNQTLINYRNQLITLSFGKNCSKVSRNEIKRFNTALNLVTNQTRKSIITKHLQNHKEEL